MAERTDCCILLLRHLRKSGGPSAIYAGGGSIGIIGAARVGLLVAWDPDEADDPTSQQGVLAITKCNLAPIAPSLSYRIVSENEVGRIEWRGVNTKRADELTQQTSHPVDDTASMFLRALLANGPVAAADVFAAGRQADHSASRLRRAFKNLGGRPSKVGFSGHWEWALPFEDGEERHITELASSSSSKKTSAESDYWGEIPL